VFHAALSSGGFAGDVNARDALLPSPNYFSDFHILPKATLAWPD
jgi:hypothetical protein